MPYTQGPVVIVSFVRTEPGMLEDTCATSDTSISDLMDGFKKKGIILTTRCIKRFRAVRQDARSDSDGEHTRYGGRSMTCRRATDPAVKEILGLCTNASALQIEAKMRKECEIRMVRQLIFK